MTRQSRIPGKVDDILTGRLPNFRLDVCRRSRCHDGPHRIDLWGYIGGYKLRIKLNIVIISYSYSSYSLVTAPTIPYTAEFRDFSIEARIVCLFPVNKFCPDYWVTLLVTFPPFCLGQTRPTCGTAYFIV